MHRAKPMPLKLHERVLRLPPGGKAAEGECVTIKLAQTPNYAGSFRHGYAVPPPSRREAFAKPIIPQIGRENNISADICL